MTSPTPITKIERPWIMAEYINNVLIYLQNKYKDHDLTDDELTYVVKQLVYPKLKDPIANTVVHDSPGNAELRELSLLAHTRDTKDGKIVLPFGSTYVPPQETTSFLKDQITTLQKNRSTSKKLMLQYKSEGDKDKAEYYNSDQNQQKIGMNSIPGAMGSKFSFISDIAGFNSVTSTGRYFIISSYSNCERLLEGNFYFPDVDTVINHCTLLTRVCPDMETVTSAMKTLQLRSILADQVVEFIESNMSLYTQAVLPPKFITWLESLDPHIRNFIYYYNNLKHIFRYEGSDYSPPIDFAKNYITELFNNTDAPQVTKDPSDLFTVDSDLLIVVATVYSELLPIVEGNRINIYDTVKMSPDVAMQLTDIAKHMQTKIDSIHPALDVFLRQRLTIPNVLRHRNMYRQTVISSDTDSIIFTTKNWIKWYTDNYKITPDTYKINTYIVYLLTKSNEKLMNLLSVHRGATEDDVYRMEMKNEYFYPVMSLSSLKKHYAGIYTIQEGNLLPKPVSDIKGVQFRGSKLSNYTLSFNKKFIDDVHLMIAEQGSISIHDIIQKLIEFELEIYNSLHAGEVKFLPALPIRLPESYTNSMSSIYFNYLVWEYIFAHKYGSIQIPTKCFILPIRKMTSIEYLRYIEKQDTEIHKKLLEFSELHSGKNITRIPISPDLREIPEECIPLIRIRDIMLDNVKPLYLFLKSINVWSGGNKDRIVLFSELYGHIPVHV